MSISTIPVIPKSVLESAVDLQAVMTKQTAISGKASTTYADGESAASQITELTDEAVKLQGELSDNEAMESVRSDDLEIPLMSVEAKKAATSRLAAVRS